MSPGRCPPVHPRVCGEHNAGIRNNVTCFGSSPRVRGTFGYIAVWWFVTRFIPACAGNIVALPEVPIGSTVHPRVCGEHSAIYIYFLNNDGSSPRVRGTCFPAPTRTARPRFIPACAGNIKGGPAFPPGRPVHPRVCGEHRCAPPLLWSDGGSSPRVRGTSVTASAQRNSHRFIPACAGNMRSDPKS